MTEVLSAQTVVIGAGVVGLATARALAMAGRDVLVLEAGDRFGEGISSRNSEVIHGGLYYPEGSLKARLCVDGRRALYQFCDEKHVGHRRCGKWVVATDAGQLPSLERVQRSAAGNGVPLDWVEGAALARALPDVQARAALWSPETGIVDSHGLMLALLGDLERYGGQLVLRAPVRGAESDGGGHLLEVGGDMPCRLRAREVINAAGLGAPALASVWQGLPPSSRPRQWLARGVYFTYQGRHPFTTLVYPLPEEGGLGVHLTLDLAGQARFGPDVAWIETEDYTVDPARADAFATSVQRWWPGLDPARLQPAYAGIRPKLTGPGSGFMDFRIDGPSEHGLPGLVHLFGIESPGLTASLALARTVVDTLG